MVDPVVGVDFVDAVAEEEPIHFELVAAVESYVAADLLLLGILQLLLRFSHEHKKAVVGDKNRTEMVSMQREVAAVENDDRV